MTSIAIFHENFAQNGGAERVAESIARLLPSAHMLSTIQVEERLSPYVRQRGIVTTWMQALPGLARWYRHYVALYPLAVHTAATRSYAVVLSSCFGFAKGAHPAKNGLHICYCHTPPRWIWRADDYVARERFGTVTRFLLKAVIRAARAWDLHASTQPDLFIANSAVVAERLFTFYGRDSVVLHPPVEVERFHIAEASDDHYLVVSRLVGYKRIDLAIAACNQLGRHLYIIGDGPDRARLEKLAGPTICFLGRQPDVEVADALSRCRALIFAGEEDFGITPLEANAAGRPVIAFGAGGALETVIAGSTGVLFDQPTVASLVQGIKRFECLNWNPIALRQHAEQFRTEVFHDRLGVILAKAFHEAGHHNVIREIASELPA